MYLLIQPQIVTGICIKFKFTSHYVSINSCVVIVHNFKCYNLHPTMYLLILLAPAPYVTDKLNLHPTMYLLIPVFSFSAETFSK